MGNSNVKEIFLCDKVGDVAVTVNGVRIEVHSDGRVDVYNAADVVVFVVGDTMEDGTIFAGVSPDTGRHMFVTPKDASGVLKWKAAMKYAARLDAYGHKDWKLPTKAELEVLYQHRDKGALKGTFDESGSDPFGWYWSATDSPDYPDFAWMKRFSIGYRFWDWKDDDASVRPVRSEPRP